VKCDAAQREISTAMDERATLSAETEDHRRTCPICAQFDAGAWRIREVARFEVAPPVPDMVPAIMARVRDEEADRLLGWGPPASPVRGWLSWLVERRAAVVAAATGVILGLVLTSGGLVPVGRVNTEALASEIPHDLVRAASGLEGYQATFDIAESNWTKAVPKRRFVATLAFMAPESFRVRVKDTTHYPSGSWPRNDLSLVTDGRTWEASGPDPCPSTNLPACPTEGPVTRSIVDRPPFDARAAMPSDIIVPMTVLAASDRVVVDGQDRVAGRDAIAVELTYQDATPLFQYLTFLGSWRPFFPQDRVVVWLDKGTWFPLQYKVFPASGPERSLWATQMGLPSESAEDPVFEATARSLSTSAPSPKAFAVRPGAEVVDEGFLDDPLPSGPGSGCPHGSGPIQPCATGGLRLYRAGRFPGSQLRPYTQSVLAYASGLAWLTVTRVDGWDQPAIFGIGPFPETVKIPGRKGTGYYLPATSTEPRRLAIHSAKGEFLVATNLPRSRLLQTAASIPVRGLPQPVAWRVRQWSGGVVEQGVARAKFALEGPAFLPTGYRRVAVQTATSGKSTGVTFVYRRPAAELDGVGLVVYQASGQDLAPPNSPDDLTVMVGHSVARWSPEDHLLEWMDGRIYRSITGPSFGLATIVRVASSLRGDAR
jgi:hypothetical protein